MTTPAFTPEPLPNRMTIRTQGVYTTTNGGPSLDRRSPELLMPHRLTGMGLGRVELPTSRLSDTSRPNDLRAPRARSNEVDADSVRAELPQMRAMHAENVYSPVYARTGAPWLSGALALLLVLTTGCDEPLGYRNEATAPPTRLGRLLVHTDSARGVVCYEASFAALSCVKVR